MLENWIITIANPLCLDDCKPFVPWSISSENTLGTFDWEIYFFYRVLNEKKKKHIKVQRSV